VTESRDRLLTPAEVASLFRVDNKTVTRWANSGRLKGVRTPGGHWRFRESDVRELMQFGGSGGEVPEPKAPGSTA
jgi:excisionase family DNA binding protein